MMFVDEARIFIKAGDGGKGCESFYRDKYMRYPRPDGGDGGRGGDVVFISNSRIQTLLDFRFKQHYQAPKGGNASSKGKKGKVGEDCMLNVPRGTLIFDYETGLLIKDLIADQQSVIVAKGGKGGIGNNHNRTPKPPRPGEERIIRLELKLIADVGIIGFPNAGKSTLISNISNVKSPIANYPFTTKHPILGIVKDKNFDSTSAVKPRRLRQGEKASLGVSPKRSQRVDFVVADLPGLIEGAHAGRGLGDRFLRHVERTRILLHVIDMAGSEGRDPLDDYATINDELRKYNDKVFFKRRIIAANKMDLPEAVRNLKRFQAKYEEDIISISALKKKGLQGLIEAIRNLLCRENSPDLSNA